MTAPHISVIMCTYNRANILRDSLASFLQVTIPPECTVELMIVNNNSTDDTARVAEEFRSKAPQLVRCVDAPTPGLSFARNVGIRATRADLIAFVDDDVYFDGQWLTQLLLLFREHPEAMCAGGRSIPLFEAGTPSWLSPRLLKIYGSTDSGDAVKRMQFPEHPFGLNMAFRKEVFATVGGFDTRLGRKKSSLLSNEETELFHRINQAGLPVFYTPHALLHHRIPAERTEKRWVLRRYYWQGISDAAFRQSTERAGRMRLARYGKWTFDSLLKQMLTELREAFRSKSNPQEGFLRRVHCYYNAGVIRQTVREMMQRQGAA